MPCSQVGYSSEQLPEPFGIVVTGYRHLDIEEAICDLPVKVVHNAAFSSGIARSLALGVAAAEADQPDGIMIMLADMPAMPSATASPDPQNVLDCPKQRTIHRRLIGGRWPCTSTAGNTSKGRLDRPLSNLAKAHRQD